MTQNPAIADDLRPIRRVSTFATMALGIAAMVSLAGVTLTGHRAGAEDGPVAENVPLAFESQPVQDSSHRSRCYHCPVRRSGRRRHDRLPERANCGAERRRMAPTP